MKAKYYLVVLAAFLIFCSRAGAITLGDPDCQNNATNQGCQHPNTVSLSGFKPDPDPLNPTHLISSGRCSGSVLRATSDMLIIVTAGHCAALYSQNLDNGAITHLGVSFDALITKLSDGIRWNSSQYVLGGKPLLNKQFGPSLHASMVSYDYGLIAFPLQNGFATTNGGNPVNVAAINPVVLPQIGFLNSFKTQSTLITNVGYGTGSVFDEEGKRTNPPTATNYEDIGVREIADHSTFLGFHGDNQNLMLSSMNPARGDNGTCGGDSGGPQFYVLNGQEYIISVTSSGDAICRSTNVTARLDTTEAQSFVQKCGYAVNSLQQFANCNLGCTEVTSKGICGK